MLQPDIFTLGSFCNFCRWLRRALNPPANGSSWDGSPPENDQNKSSYSCSHLNMTSLAQWGVNCCGATADSLQPVAINRLQLWSSSSKVVLAAMLSAANPAVGSTLHLYCHQRHTWQHVSSGMLTIAFKLAVSKFY